MVSGSLRLNVTLMETLNVKGFTQKDDIDYKEKFSPVLQKDSFIIIMALISHYDLELH